MKSKRHIRHQSSARNNRKMKHHVEDAIEEVAEMRSVIAKFDDMGRYLAGRLYRISNRLSARE